MAATNVQAFSGDVEISSNVTAANSKFSLDTNGTFKQENLGGNGRYIKLMKYFGSGSNWKIATGSYTGPSYQWLSIRAKMTRLDQDVEIIQFNYLGHNGTSRVRDSIVIGGGISSTQDNEIKVYNKTSNSTYEIYLQIDSATSVEVEISHRGSTIDDDYSTVATANNGAIDETGLTKIYDSGTTTDLRLKEVDVGIGTPDPDARLHIKEPSDISATTRLFHIENRFAGGSVGHFEIFENKIGAGNGWSDFTLKLQRRVDTTVQGYIEFNPSGSTGDYGIAFGTGTVETMRLDAVNGRVGIGTNNPMARCHVGGTILDTDPAKETIPAANPGASANFPVTTRAWFGNRIGATGEDYWGLAIGTLYSGASYLQNLNKQTSEYYDVLLQPNGGRVGIGTTNPSAKLQVGGNTETSPQYLWIRGNRINEAGDIAGIHFYNSLNSGDRGNSRIISSRGTNNYGSNLEFWTNPDDNVPALERMRIASSGNVGIGTTNPDNATLHIQTGGLHIGGTVLRASSSIPTTASGTFTKLCDFTALPTSTLGVVTLRITWGNGRGGNVQYYWFGSATVTVPYNTYSDGNGIYNGGPSDAVVVNQFYHHRTVGPLTFRLDSDNSGGVSYGRLSLYVAPNAAIDDMSFIVTALQLRR